MRYLDDRYCNKKFPSQFDREWVCPSSFDDANLEGFSADAALGDVDVNVDILPGIVTNNANICLILTRRQNGKPYHKYELLFSFTRLESSYNYVCLTCVGTSAMVKGVSLSLMKHGHLRKYLQWRMLVVSCERSVVLLVSTQQQLVILPLIPDSPACCLLDI